MGQEGRSEEGTGQESRGKKSAGEKGHGQEGDKKGHEENRGKKDGREKDRVKEGRTQENRRNQRRRPDLIRPCRSGFSRERLIVTARRARGRRRSYKNARAAGPTIRRLPQPTPDASRLRKEDSSKRICWEA